MPFVVIFFVSSTNFVSFVHFVVIFFVYATNFMSFVLNFKQIMLHEKAFFC